MAVVQNAQTAMDTLVNNTLPALREYLRSTLGLAGGSIDPAADPLTSPDTRKGTPAGVRDRGVASGKAGDNQHALEVIDGILATLIQNPGATFDFPGTGFPTVSGAPLATGVPFANAPGYLTPEQEEARSQAARVLRGDRTNDPRVPAMSDLPRGGPIHTAADKARAEAERRAAAAPLAKADPDRDRAEAERAKADKEAAEKRKHV